MKNVVLGLLAVTLSAAVAWAEPTDRLDQMIAPAFHVTNFEDPRSLSEARFLYAYHEFDNEFVTEGGNVQVYALQLRYAIDERWTLLATKDGYTDLNPKANVPSDEGFNDVEVGAKYAFWLDREAGEVASAQLRYIIPIGEKEVFQGEGDGVIHPSVSGAVAFCDSLTVTAGTGLRIPISDDDSSFWDVDAQADYRIDTSVGAVHPFLGASLIHVMNGGDRLPIQDEGEDFFNFGSSASTGEDMVIGAAGLRYRPADKFELGATYQFPLDRSSGSRVIDYRWSFDAIYRM